MEPDPPPKKGGGTHSDSAVPDITRESSRGKFAWAYRFQHGI